VLKNSKDFFLKKNFMSALFLTTLYYPMNKIFLLFGFLLEILVFTCILIGCGHRSTFSTEPVDGLVTLDGKPLNQATITFSPILNETPDAKPAYGLSDEGGKFKMTAANGGLEGKGTTIGKYVICITKIVGMTSLSDEEIKKRNAQGIAVQLEVKSVIPQKYSDISTSGLNFEVVRGKNTCILELKSE
jgi:hypothetical protein